MPSSCCVPNCPVSVIRGNVDTYAFTFPKDPVRRKQWLKAIGRQEYNVSRGSVICSRHFDESCIVRPGRAVGESAAPKSKMRLTASACPTRNIGGIDLRLPAAPSNAFIYRGVRNDASLVPPIRQTASIFKQPVTVYRTQEGKVKADFKHGPQEKPKQLFWEKRLEGMRASDANGNPLERMELPKSLRAAGPGVRDETVLQSVATALHVLTQPITGQATLKPGMEKNASVFINPEQPLIQAINISDDDIKRQEERVNLARKKLQEAMRGYDL